MNDQHEELLQFFKTFVDINRLKLIGVLAHGEASLQELTEQLGMTGSEITRHMEQLLETGLVHQKQLLDKSDLFELQPHILEEMAKRQFTQARKMAPPNPDLRQMPPQFTEDERKIVINFTHPSGEIKQIPLQPKKQQILVRYARHYVLSSLTPGKQYTEKEINLLIKHLHPDSAFFRRAFVDTGYLARHANGSAYWVTEKAQTLSET